MYLHSLTLCQYTFNIFSLDMSILFSNFAVGKEGNTLTSTTNPQTSYIMNTIKLFGNVGDDITNFRKEVKELSKDWEINYTFTINKGKYNYLELVISHKSKYEYKSTLLQDADEISDYLEQWTKFRVEMITLT